MSHTNRRPTCCANPQYHAPASHCPALSAAFQGFLLLNSEQLGADKEEGKDKYKRAWVHEVRGVMCEQMWCKLC